jgi:hypothetical protein
MSTYADRDPDSIDVSNPAEPVQPGSPLRAGMIPVGRRILYLGMFYDRDELDLPELDDDGESAWERSCEDYYGGSSPQTLSEQREVARRLK